MNFNEQYSKNKGDSKNQGEWQDPSAPHACAGSEGSDPEIESVLRGFRASVHAWSDAVYQRPRLVEAAPARIAWRRAVAWALGSVLLAGGAGGGFLQYQHRQELARIAAAREAEHERQLREDSAREAEQELAKVDSDVSREVPDAMEPLAQLMTSDANR